MCESSEEDAMGCLDGGSFYTETEEGRKEVHTSVYFHQTPEFTELSSLADLRSSPISYSILLDRSGPFAAHISVNNFYCLCQC